MLIANFAFLFVDMVGGPKRNGKGRERNRPPEAIQLEIGKRIRKRRQKLGITIRELAKRAGMNRQHLGEIERGTNNVRIETIIELTRCLDTTIPLLFQRLEENAERNRAARSLTTKRRTKKG